MALKGAIPGVQETFKNSTLTGDYTIMKIRPLYDRVVVKRIEEKETMRSGIIIPDSAQEKPQEAEVIAVGRGKRLEDGEVVALDVKVGDRILFGKYSGNDITVDGQPRHVYALGTRAWTWETWQNE